MMDNTKLVTLRRAQRLVTKTMSEISTAKAAAITAANSYTDQEISTLSAVVDGKQDELAFMSGNYDKTSNKAVTASDLSAAVAGLSGAMHFAGEVETLPSTVEGYNSGDVILVGNKEYVCDGTKWIELGDETIYAVKGDIKNADIASDAAIAQSKIAGLVDALAAKATNTRVEALETYVGTASEGSTAATGLTAQVEALESAVGTAGSYNFDAAGAAAAVQGDTTATVEDIEDAINSFTECTEAEIDALFTAVA